MTARAIIHCRGRTAVFESNGRVAEAVVVGSMPALRCGTKLLTTMAAFVTRDVLSAAGGAAGGAASLYAP